MNAAVVTSFDQPPRYQPFADPVTQSPNGEVVSVLAAGLHPRARSGAAGSHYTGAGELPLIPGIDGVGHDEQGELRYFVLPDTRLGSMAERVAIDRRRSVALPPDTDVTMVAAAMNPAMSSWIALRERISFEPGQKVLVLGATGNAGQLAVQVAKHFGAGVVVAAGRDGERLRMLRGLGADATVSLAGDPHTWTAVLAGAAANVDVVVDYLWGPPTELVIPAMLMARENRSRLLQWIQIGSMADRELTLPSEWLRAANIQIMGSGQGSVSTRAILGVLPAIAAEISSGAFALDVVPKPLRDVETVWTSPIGAGQRVVLVP